MDDPYNSGMVYRDSHCHSGSGRGGICAQYPGSAPSNTSHPPNSVLTAEVPGFVPRGVLEFDRPTQYPPRPFTGSFYPGNIVVGRPCPIPQQVPVQAPFPPMGSGAPSGASMPSGSPPLHLGGTPAPLSFPPYDYRLVMSPVPPGRQDIQPISVSGVSFADHVQPSYTPPMLRRNGPCSAPPNAHPRSQKPFSLCPVCAKVINRPTDRDRHLLIHLPYWIACASDGCAWRGYRLDTFRTHLWDQHQSAMPNGRGYYELYDPEPLVEDILKNSVSIGDAEQRAIAEVKRMAYMYGKQEWLEDPSGRQGRKCPRR